VANNIRTILLCDPDLDPKMRRRMELCGVPGSWGVGYCRLAACDRCWRQRVSNWTLEAFDVLADSSTRDLRWIEVALDPVSDVEELTHYLAGVRKMLRNVIARLRDKDARANSIRIIGAFDIGWDAAKAAWLPRLRALMDFSGADEWLATEMMFRQWPGFGRLAIRPVHPGEDLERAIELFMERLLFRSLIPNLPPDVVRALHEAAFRSGGFRMFRFHLRPAGPRESPAPKVAEGRSPAWVSVSPWSDHNPFRR
jgi:hypothetical protein